MRIFTPTRGTNSVLTMKYFSVGDCIQTFCVHILKFLIHRESLQISHTVLTVYTSLIHLYSAWLCYPGSWISITLSLRTQHDHWTLLFLTFQCVIMVADFTASRLSFLVTWPNIKASINLFNPQNTISIGLICRQWYK